LTGFSTFIKELVHHFSNRASQRENTSVKIYNIHKDFNKEDYILEEPLPEYIDGKKVIPDEVYVLVGYSTTSERFNWYEDNHKYIFRMDDIKGSLELDNEVVNAKYLLIRRNGKEDASDLYKIVSKGPKVFSNNQLDKLNYPPSKRPKEYYLSIEIEKVTDIEFENKVWKFKELKRYKSILESEANPYSKVGLPFTVSLKDLMKVVKKENI